MNPIKTTNAMNPAPAKGIESFPTPVIDDVVIAEVVNAWKGDYQPLEYGTLWRDVSHAPNQGSFPEHKLVFQQPTSEDGQWIKRIWVNDRVNQDSYNYAIKYSAGSQDHPIYIRTYVVPRETYAPLPDGTPDPLFPSALLVDEEATRIEGELDSKYISVTRVYETLPGPQVPTKRYNERGDLETVTVQTVPPFTSPSPDGLFITQSQVVQEEMGKGVKTTAIVQKYSTLTIKEKKEGLLGDTITTDNIVSPTTNPDELSEEIISSVVEQFSANKARKRTTKSTGPTTLSGEDKKDGLLGETKTTQKIVPSSKKPENLSMTVIASSVEPIDAKKSKLTTIELLGPNKLITKSLVDSAVGQVEATVEKSVVSINQEPDGGKTVIQDEINAIDSVKAIRERVTVYDYPNLTTYDLDEQLGVSVITERSVVDHNAPYNAPNLVISFNDRPLDKWKTLRITSRLSKLPDIRTEYKTQQFTFPSILDGVVVNTANLGFGRVPINDEETQYATGINKFVSIVPKIRPGLSLPTRIRIVTTFHTSPPTPDTPYKIVTQNVSYNGSLFGFNFGDVITDGFQIGPISAAGYDPRFSGLAETVSFSASNPSRSSYTASIGSEVVIYCDVEYYKSNIWTKRTGYITLI